MTPVPRPSWPGQPDQSAGSEDARSMEALAVEAAEALKGASADEVIK